MKLALGATFVSRIPLHYPPTLDLFKQFFLQYYNQYGRTRLLHDVGLCQHSQLGGPSWVPDWLTNFAKLDLSMECAASHGMLAEAQYIGHGTLRVRGCFATKVICADTLRSVEDLLSDDFGEAHAELSRFMRTHLRLNDTAQMHAFVRALCCPLMALQVSLRAPENKLQDIENLAQATMDSEKYSHCLSERLLDRNSLHRFQACTRHFMQHKLSFILTEDGYVGTGPDQVETGDLVAAVFGSTNLYILRPVHISDETRRYCQLVGSCYMHGYNWGATLLGPLPHGFKVVLRLRPDRGVYVPYYANELTGEADFWNPRIDWTVLTPEADDIATMINAPPGEPSRKVPTAAYFKTHHGAIIDEIFLV